MKKQIVCFVFFTFSIVAVAQDFSGGVKLGFSASQISGDQISGFDKAGPVAGGWVNYMFTRKDAFQFEIFYVQKGSRKNDTDEDPTKYKLRLNYVEAPLLYKRFFNKKLSGEIGPSVGVLFDSYEGDENGEWPDGREEFKSIDLSLAYGFRYNFNERISFGIRFQQSMLPVRDHPGGGAYRLDRGQYSFVFVNSLDIQL